MSSVTSKTVKVTHEQKVRFLRARLEKPGAPRILVESHSVPSRAMKSHKATSK